MPIEIVVKISEEHKECIWVDGHLTTIKEDIKRIDILDALEYMGYIVIKVEE